MRMSLITRLIVGLVLFGVTSFAIKGFVKDKADELNAKVGFENIPANAIDIEDSQSLYQAENFGAALTALEERVGGKAELLRVGVLPYMAEFQVKHGETAKGFRYYAKNGEMGAFKIKIVGSGSLEGSQFPYAKISADVTEKLAAAVTARDGALRVTNMTIERAIIDGDLAWSVNAESDARTGIVFQADLDGSGLDDPAKRALAAAGAA